MREQCIVCSGMHVRNGSKKWVQEDTVSNDDENDGFRKAHESPKGSFSSAGPRVTAYSIETVTRVTSRDIMSR